MVCLLGPAGPARAAEVDSFRLSQVCAIHPAFNAFVEVLDADGNMVTNVQKDQLSAVLGTQALKINDLQDFNQATAQGVAYILLVDISKSLSVKEFAAMRQVLQGWIEGMGPNDRAAIVTFGTEVKTLQDFSSDRPVLNNLIAQLKPTDKDTQLHKGLIKAMELGSRADPELPARRVIITLSDGQDDFAGGSTPKEVFDMMKTDPVPIYAIGYYSAPRKSQKEEALKSLGAFARTSGGSYFRAESNTIPEMFNRMKQRIMDVYQVEFLWPEGKWDGDPRRLQMTYKEGPKVLNAGLDMRLRARPEIVLKGGDGGSPPGGNEGGSVVILQNHSGNKSRNSGPAYIPGATSAAACSFWASLSALSSWRARRKATACPRRLSWIKAVPSRRGSIPIRRCGGHRGRPLAACPGNPHPPEKPAPARWCA